MVLSVCNVLVGQRETVVRGGVARRMRRRPAAAAAGASSSSAAASVESFPVLLCVCVFVFFNGVVV